MIDSAGTRRSCARRSTSRATWASRWSAEGVETEADAPQLDALGCDIAQGYCLCRPLPAARAATRRSASTEQWSGRATARPRDDGA